jgi:hypothetical protein
MFEDPVRDQLYEFLTLFDPPAAELLGLRVFIFIAKGDLGIKLLFRRLLRGGQLNLIAPVCLEEC